MGNEDMLVKLHADVGEYLDNMSRATDALKKFEETLGRMPQEVDIGSQLGDIAAVIGDLEGLADLNLDVILSDIAQNCADLNDSLSALGQVNLSTFSEGLNDVFVDLEQIDVGKISSGLEGAFSGLEQRDFGKFTESIGSAFDELGQIDVGKFSGDLSSAFDDIAAAADNPAKAIGDLVPKLTGLSGEDLENAKTTMDDIGSAVSVMGDKFKSLSGSGISGLGATFSGFGGSLSMLMGPATGMIAPLMALQVSIAGISIPILPLIAVIGALVAIFLYLWTTNEGFRNAVTEIWNSVSALIGQAAAIIQNVLSGLIGFIVVIIQTLWTIVAPFIDIFVNGILTAFQTLASLLGPIVDGAFQNIQTIIGTATGLISGIINTFTGILSGDWNKAWEGIKKTIDTIWGGIESVISTSVDRLKGFVGGFVGTAVDGLNTLIGLWNMIPGAPHIEPLSKSSVLPGFAEGGIVTKPTVALIGEAGPEAVVPLGKGFFGGIRNDVTVSVTYNNYAQNGENDEKTVKVIREAVNRGLRDSGIITGA